MRFLLSDLVAACDGELLTAGDPVGSVDAAEPAIDGVTIDSRSVAAGQLFVPLVAERDGHDFIAGAVASGAGAYLTTRATPEPAAEPALRQAPAIRVDDTQQALTEIGRLARTRLSGPVIGITGSVGKTSVKDLTKAACNGAGMAWASAASFNNELGVPLTLANAPAETEIAIVEMGSRGIGHIAELCELAKPTIGLVTCVALAHSELFGSLDGVAKGKGELIEALPADGVAVLNADDPRVLAMAGRTDASVMISGGGRDGDGPGPATIVGARPERMLGHVGVRDLSLDRLLRPTFTIDSPSGSATVTLPARGAHMATNAAAAVAAALAAGVAFDDAVGGLLVAEVSRWRMEVGRAADGPLVINDAYNANPTSMRAALESLLAVEADRRVAVVGVMAELGEEGPAEHRAIAAEAAEAGVRVIAVDAEAYGQQAEHVADRGAALALLAGLGPDTAVLVKGSRVAELEHLAASLLQG